MIKKWLDNRKLTILNRDGTKPYLHRWYLLHPDSVERERKDIRFNVLLHQFMESDEPVWHDHPWNYYISIVLRGGYWEHTPHGTSWFGPGSIRKVEGGSLVLYDAAVEDKVSIIPADLHWIEIPESGKTWTLFIRGRTIKDWGFVPDLKTGEWINHREYLKKYRNDL